MSALPEEPSHFLDWLKTREPQAHPGTFASRRVYGDYLQGLLHSVSQPGMPVELVRDEVVELCAATEQEDRLLLRTSSGRLFQCERVVLAMGNQPPLDPEGIEALATVKLTQPTPGAPACWKASVPVSRWR